jgi:hypothetical protein
MSLRLRGLLFGSPKTKTPSSQRERSNFKDIKQFEIRWTDRKERWVEGFLGAHENNSPA